MRTPGNHNTEPPARILLVDDNRLGMLARKKVLEELGYRIATAAGGHEALEQFSKGAFDIVVTDYKMPSMDGLELIQRIREKEPEIPVILLSGFAEPLGLDETNTGANIVIQKSAHEVSQLVRSVGRLLRRKTPKKPAAVQPAAQPLKRRAAT